MMGRQLVVGAFVSWLCFSACGISDVTGERICPSFIEYRLQSPSGNPVDEFSVTVTAIDTREPPGVFETREELHLQCPSGEMEGHDAFDLGTCSEQGGFDYRVGTFDILDDLEFQLTVDSTQGTFDGVPELGPRRPLTEMRPGSFCLTNAFVYPSLVVLTPD